MSAASSALNANVLVLNRMYMAIRVTSARRAFSLLCRELAEVIHQRINQYVAEFHVKAIDGVWKITELELLQEERMQ